MMAAGVMPYATGVPMVLTGADQLASPDVAVTPVVDGMMRQTAGECRGARPTEKRQNQEGQQLPHKN